MGDLREPNGVVSEDSLVLPSSSTSLCFGPEVWARPEDATQKIIRQVQPTVASEERRRDVIDYVQRLLKAYLGCEVFPFGSVPLRTYLPDGDIDLTAFCAFSFEEGFANDVYSVLEAEDRNPLAEFVVKDVQYIRAEVKLVKCLVQNIVVDLSFNQIGGLCALCFLEEVDRLIAKDHLFKRSIILIKAWCYYESRILGAHHGLISTYALETLVLYIFHLFHSSLNGPLAVLFKFLDYFSKFDWDNYCVSLSGPVPVSTLPEIVADKPENGGDDLLLSDDFIRECVNKFSVPSRGTDTRMFVQKYLNIVDPLKENNNLGRSVSKGNFFRIRSALSFGARKLGQILLQPQENIAEEVRRFFTNTLERHGQGHRPDVQDLPGCNGFVPEILVPNCQEDNNNYGHEEESLNSSDQSIEFTNVRDDPSASPSRLSGDAWDLASSGVRDLRITTQSSDKLLGNVPPYTPHLYLPHSLNNGKIENGDLDEMHHQPTQANRDFSTFTDTNLVNSDIQKILPDLSGEVECHLESLRYGRWWYEHVPNMPVRQLHMPPPPPPLFQRKNTWDPIRQPSLHFRQDMVPHMSVNGVHPFFPMNPQVVPGAAFAVDEMPKTRGTGTYFPITNHNSYRDRYSQGKGRPHGQLRSPRANGRTQTPLDRSPQPQSPVRQGSGKLSSPRGKAFTSEKPEEAALAERDSNKAQDSSAISENGENPMLVLNYDRLAVQSYRLKDDGDFPSFVRMRFEC